MTVVSESYSTAQTSAVLIPPQAGQIIRVVRVVITAWTDVRITLLSDPGPAPDELLAPLYAGKSGPVCLRLGRSHAIVTERGRGLGMHASFNGTAGQYSVSVWYEVVS